MNKMSCRFRQNSCAKWKGKKEAFAKKKVCNFRGEEGRGRRKKRIEYMPKSAGFALKRKKVAFKRDFKEIT